MQELKLWLTALFGHGTRKVWQRNFLYFRYAIWVNFLWVVIEPTLLLFAIGRGLGGYVGEVNGVPYIEFYFPGLMVASGMMVSFYETTYGSSAKLNREKTFQSLLTTPLMPYEVALGEIAWAATKGFISACGLGLVVYAQGLITTWLVFPALFVTALVCWMFAAFGLWLTATASKNDWFIYAQTGLIIPMYLFSGTYFPIEALPKVLQSITFLSPLSHGVVAVRGLLMGEIPHNFIIHLAIILTLAVGLTHMAVHRLSQKLIA